MRDGFVAILNRRVRYLDLVHCAAVVELLTMDKR